MPVHSLGRLFINKVRRMAAASAHSAAAATHYDGDEYGTTKKEEGV